MPSNVTTRVYSLVQDNKGVLVASNFVRPFHAGNWNKIRVCCRVSITDGGAGIFAQPNHFAFGICSGSSLLFNSASTKQFVGVITFIGTGGAKVNVTRTVGPPFQVTHRVFPAKKTGVNITGIVGDTTASNPYVNSEFYQYDGTGGPYRSLFFVDITRPYGSTVPTIGPYTINIFCHTSGASPYDASKAEFLAQAIAPTPALLRHTFYTNPATFSNPAATLTIDCDEIAAPFDHVCAASDEAKYNFEISEVGYVKML